MSNKQPNNTSVNPELLPEGALVYEMIIPVRWGDMDALGHVNNIIYFQYFETIRLAWAETMGITLPVTDGKSIVIVNNHAEYLLPIVYPANLTLRMGVHSLGRSSFMSAYTISIADKLMTRGSAKIVCMNYETMKSMPVPDNMMALIEPPKG